MIQNTMQGGAESSSPNCNTGERKAVVLFLAKGNDDLSTSLVFCLDENGAPFRLCNDGGWYIWRNRELRKIGIDSGSIITYKRCKQGFLYSGKTGKMMDVYEVVSKLPFGRVHHGIKDAFPEAVTGETCGLSQETRPNPPYALISISHAVTRDNRIIFRTQLDEEVDLSNRSLTHTSNSIEAVTLLVQVPTSDEDSGGVVLVGFGSKPTYVGRFQAMCEGIILKPAQGVARLGRYRMSRHPRGLCLIINNLEFHDKAKNRYGGEFDEQKFTDLFIDLSFDVHTKNDLKSDEIMDTTEEYASKDHTDFDAFVMIVMTHGGDGDAIYGVKGKAKISVADLMAQFQFTKCPSLANKPKIFIFQTCRGSLNEGMVPPRGSDRYMADAVTNDSTLVRSTTPLEADFLLAFATVPGYVSWRDEQSGSLYIQVLVEVISQLHEHHHLLDMLTEVNRQVAERAGNAPGARQQIPAPVHTLRLQLYL